MFSEIKKLVKHSGVYAFGSLSGHFLSFLLLPVYTRFLTTEQYGILALVTVFRTILQRIVNMGTESSVVKVYFEVDEERRKFVISTAFFFILMAALTSTAVLWAFRRNLSVFFFNSPELSVLFSLALMTSCFFLVNTVPFSVFRAQEKVTLYTVFSVFALLSGILFNILFVVVFRQNVQGILKSAVLSQGITLLLILIPFSRSLVLAFKKEYLMRMLTFGLPLVPSGLAMWILTLLDRYFLKVFATMEIVGIYSLGYKISMIMAMLVVIPFSMAWSPIMLKWHSEGGSKELYVRTFKYYSVVGFFFVLVISLLSKEVIEIMTTAPYYSAYKIVFLITLSYLFNGFYMIFTAGCTFARKTFYFSIATGSAAILNTILNIILIPHFKMMGAAAATAVSYFAMMALTLFFSERYFHIPFNFGAALKIGLVTTVLYIAGLFINGEIYFSIPLKLLIIVCFFPLLYVLRIFTRNEVEVMKRAMRKRK